MKLKCAQCKKDFPVHLLDCKPSSATFRRNRLQFGQLAALQSAADHGDQFDRMECRECYGGGFVEGAPMSVLITGGTK